MLKSVLETLLRKTQFLPTRLWEEGKSFVSLPAYTWWRASASPSQVLADRAVLKVTISLTILKHAFKKTETKWYLTVLVTLPANPREEGSSRWLVLVHRHHTDVVVPRREGLEPDTQAQAEHSLVLQKGSKLPPEEDWKETSRSNRKKIQVSKDPLFLSAFFRTES